MTGRGPTTSDADYRTRSRLRLGAGHRVGIQNPPAGPRAAPLRTPCKKSLSLPVISSREYLRAVYGLDTIYTHSLAYTIDRCTKEMPTFMSTYAQMSTQHSCGHPGRTQAMAAAASARPKPQPPLLRDVAIAMAIAAILHA